MACYLFIILGDFPAAVIQNYKRNTILTRLKFSKEKIIAQALSSISWSRLEEFRQYTRELEDKFENDKEKVSDAYNAAIKDLEEDDRNEIIDYFSDDYFIIEDIFIGMYRKSTLVSLYSFLENALNTLCIKLYSLKNYPVELKDIRGEGIVRSKVYLEKLGQIEFTHLNSQWSSLLTLNKLRNCIVHCEGNIKLSNNYTKLNNIINESDNLSLIDDRNIKIEREYIDFLITQIEKFLKDIYQQAFTNKNNV